MGLKRKASALELDALPLPPHSLPHTQWQQFQQYHHQPSSPPSLTSSAASPGSSPSSMDTEPYHSTLLPDHHNHTNSQNSYFAAPWLHTRTRKRVRDNRPDESLIHHETVRRLFDAQRAGGPQQFLSEDAMMDGSMDTGFAEPYLVSQPDTSMGMDMGMDTDTQAVQLDSSLALDAPEANQRSIHDFFARMKGKERAVPVATGASSSNMPPVLLAVEAPLREKRSFGVLSGMNRGSSDSLRESAGLYADVPASTAAGIPGSVACLPCDFRPAEVVAALMEDAMVMG